MLHDILTVIWKERKGLFRFRGSRVRFLLVLMTPVLLATVFPFQAGPDWVAEAPAVILAGIIPVVLVGITIPESFAGERERHTLGTLLASRLPDRAILLGKVTVAVVFAWGVTVAVLLVALVVVNVTHWQGSAILYTPPVALGSLALSFLMATLFASLGVLISMRSQTVQEAAQFLMAVLLVPAMALQVVFFVFVDRLRDIIRAVDGLQILLTILAVLVVADLMVFALAMARFQRSRLSLD